MEHAPDRKRGFYGSFPQIGNVLGLVLATGTFSLLTLLPEQDFLAWGWRIPFLASLILLGVGVYIRLKVLESPLFARAREENQAQERIPIVDLVKHHWRNLLLGVCTRICVDVQGYIIITFSISYLANQVGTPEGVGTLATALAGCAAIITAPFFGALSDRIGRKRVYSGGAALGIVLAFPFFWLLDTGSTSLVVLGFVLIYAFSNFSCNGVLGTFLAEMFPTRIRYSGISCSYHLTSIVGGSIAPFIATSLVGWSGGASWPVSLYLIAAAVISLVAVSISKETYLSSLADELGRKPQVAGEHLDGRA